MNIVLSSRKLTDGSRVWAVNFQADNHTVRVECNSEADAQALADMLTMGAAYAEINAR